MTKRQVGRSKKEKETASGDVTVIQHSVPLPAGKSSGLVSGMIGNINTTHVTLIAQATGSDGSTIVETEVVSVR